MDLLIGCFGRCSVAVATQFRLIADKQWAEPPNTWYRTGQNDWVASRTQCVCWSNKVINTAAVLINRQVCTVDCWLQIWMDLRVAVSRFESVGVCVVTKYVETW